MLTRLGAVVALALTAGVLAAPVAHAGPHTDAAVARTAVVAATKTRPAVVRNKLFGHSVDGRKLVAWQLGNPDARRTAVVMAAMHGDERAARRILRTLRDGRKIRRLNLWLIISTNPDGIARKHRRNAHGVDLNRNFGVSWRRTSWGQTYSGPRAKSEPETRALVRFMRDVRPDQVVSFHQPLYGIDTSGNGTRKFARKLARNLHLPRKEFACGSGCHGTMSQWFNKRLDGKFVTVELSRHPSRRYLTTTAPRGLLRALGGRYA